MSCIQNIPSYAGIGCSDFQIKAKDDSVVCARSMDYFFDLDWDIKVYCRGESHYSWAPSLQTKGYNWSSEYGFVAVQAYIPLTTVVEGLNEKGLSFGLLSLKGTEYAKVTDDAKAMHVKDVGLWILGCFATIDEVEKHINDVIIWSLPFVDETHEMGFHIALHDATGRNGVIEFLGGKVHFYENPLGVLTNDPPLEWQVDNLRSYNGLSPETLDDYEIKDITIPSLVGNGMVGLPGDWSAPSRFVKIAQCMRFMEVPKKGEEAINEAFHILNTVDIPSGLKVKKIALLRFIERAEWVTVKDLTKRVVYYRSFGDQGSINSIPLDELDFSVHTKYEELAIRTDVLTIKNVISQLRV